MGLLRVGLVKHRLHVWLEVVAGSVADRERRKWVEKAVALSNNPYTEESIVRRRSSATGPEFVSLRCNNPVCLSSISVTLSPSLNANNTKDWNQFNRIILPGLTWSIVVHLTN